VFTLSVYNMQLQSIGKKQSLPYCWIDLPIQQ